MVLTEDTERSSWDWSVRKGRENHSTFQHEAQGWLVKDLPHGPHSKLTFHTGSYSSRQAMSPVSGRSTPGRADSLMSLLAGLPPLRDLYIPFWLPSSTKIDDDAIASDSEEDGTSPGGFFQSPLRSRTSSQHASSGYKPRIFSLRTHHALQQEAKKAQVREAKERRIAELATVPHVIWLIVRSLRRWKEYVRKNRLRRRYFHIWRWTVQARHRARLQREYFYLWRNNMHKMRSRRSPTH